MNARGQDWQEFKDTLNISEEQQGEIEIVSGIINAVIEARNKKGLTQKTLAEITGLKQSVISRLENTVHYPQIDTVIKVLKPLGYTLAVVPLQKEQPV